MSPDILAAVVTAVLSGGIFAGVASLYNARKKAPAERDSVIVRGAEKAVLTLQATLAAETKRADRAEAALVAEQVRITEKDARIAALETKLDALQAALDAARDELHEIILASKP